MKNHYLIIAAIFYMPLMWAQNSLVEKGNIVRVLSFNILHGATTEGNFDFDRIAKVIIDNDPDIVALQEVDFNTNRVNKRDILTELALRTNMTSVFINAMDYDDGEYGEGILSKRSFIEVKNVSLPHSPKNEPKAAAISTLILKSGDTINFIATHLDHLREGIDRLAQAKAINDIFIDKKHPKILAGDLNDVPGSKPIETLELHWGASYNKEDPQPTYPSHNPERKIDYVMFYPKNRWRVLKTKEIHDEIASDHFAYLAVIELLPKE